VSSDEEVTISKKKTKSKSKTSKNSKKSSKTKKKAKHTIQVEDDEDSSESQGENGWTASEEKLLVKAVEEVDPSAPQYWKQVAKLVKSKSHVECQTKYQAKFKTPTTTRTKRKTKEEESPMHIGKTGKLFEGRLKDKEKIRNIVKNSQKSHSDDIFETTPLKEKTSSLEVELSDDDEIEKKYFSGRGNTPAKKGIKDKESPELLKKPVNRKEVDSYVNQIKTKAKKAEKNKKTDVFRFEDFVRIDSKKL
jgi:hypothetical protein